MGNVIQDKVAIRANQSRDIHVSVVDAEIVTLSDEAFDDFDDRTLAEIVCSCLEAESQDPDTLTSAVPSPG